MNIYAYCRVSTTEQKLDRQIEAINQYCQENNVELTKWYKDKASGKSFDRTNYKIMRANVQKGDVIIIKELDRFGRKMEEIKKEWQYFMEKGVRIVVIELKITESQNCKNKCSRKI